MRRWVVLVTRANAFPVVYGDEWARPFDTYADALYAAHGEIARTILADLSGREAASLSIDPVPIEHP